MKHIKPASFILLGLVSLTAACQQKPAETPKATATMTEDQKAIYAYGAAIGQQLAEQNKQLRLSPEELEVFRTAFGDTVSGKEPAVKMTQQDKMKACNADEKAKTLKGDERKKFMSECLSKKA